MNDHIEIRLSQAINMQKAGESLTHTLYGFPVDILLSGELGSGKTTFVQGMAKGLGIDVPIASPTYALQQHYVSPKGVAFEHVDLYRLNDAQAAEFLATHSAHQGIRCIEWADRSSRAIGKGIHLIFREEGNGRRVTIRFEDIAIPTPAQIEAWRKECAFPLHIAEHCETVAHVTDTLADLLLAQGRIVRKGALHAAGELHDLFRFLDFKHGGAPDLPTASRESQIIWERLSQEFPYAHEEGCSRWLIAHGFPEIARIVLTHGWKTPPGPDATIEQLLLCYADKRVTGSAVVTIQQRFDDFAQRYGKGTMTPAQQAWHAHIQDIEKQLFPNGAPLFA